jgi:hypothetical protein
MRSANPSVLAPSRRTGAGGLLPGRRPAVFLAAGFRAAVVIAYWISVYGRFGGKEVTGGWAVILAESGEYVAVVGGVAPAGMLLRRPRWPALRPPERIPVAQ